jgi:hypothetical protein
MSALRTGQGESGSTRRRGRRTAGCRAPSGWPLTGAVGKGGARHWWGRGVCAAAIAGVAACTAPPVVVPVPAFPPPSSVSTSSRPPPEEPGHQLPGDCEQLVEHDELSGLFGLPVGSVAVRTLQGTPSPSVGRLERMTCTYTASSPAPAPWQGVVLQMTIGAYRDAAAAHDQYERNVADQRIGASSSVDSDLGAAASTLVARDGDSVLLTSFDTVTLDLDMARPGPLPPGDMLTDLARRVLARLVPSRPFTAPQ